MGIPPHDSPGCHAVPARASVAALVLLLGACSSSTGPAHLPRTAPPSKAADCNALAPTNPDGGVLTGFAWSTGDHPLRAAATVYICFVPSAGDTAIVQSDSKTVAVRPTRILVQRASNGVVPLRGSCGIAGYRAT